MTKSNLKAIALMLPIVVMALFTAGNIYNQQAGQLWRIPVTGYDPRDLLRGHYLTYRYDWNWREDKRSCVHGECVLCLSPSNGHANPFVTFAERGNTVQCTSYIEGRVYGNDHFEIGSKHGYGLRRYYIPEEHARTLDKMLRRNNGEHNFEISLRVNSTGKAFIEGMYINNQPLEEWIKQNPTGE